MNSLCKTFINLSIGKQQHIAAKAQLPIISCIRFYENQVHEIPTPKPGKGRQFRRYEFHMNIGYVH